MGAKVTGIDVGQWNLMKEGTTQVSDWVIELDGLSASALALYVWMSRAAKEQDTMWGLRLAVPCQSLDEHARGDGKAALAELLKVGAVSKEGPRRGRGKIRLKIEEYPPEARKLIDEAPHAGGLPLVSYC